jgi:hypothetical protein
MMRISHLSWESWQGSGTFSEVSSGQATNSKNFISSLPAPYPIFMDSFSGYDQRFFRYDTSLKDSPIAEADI